jgi:hypothetical protein
VVIVTQEVQKTVQRKDLQLDGIGMPGLPGLPARNAFGNNEIAQRRRRVRRETQHVCRLVFAAELPVQGAHAGVGDEGDRDLAARAPRRDAREPGPQTWGAHRGPAPVRDGHAEPRRTTGIHRTLRTP